MSGVGAPNAVAAPRKVRQVHALTGVRIIAALWVVLFHLRGNLAAEFPELTRVIGPVINHGELGVDLFFALSGYVLALNYGSRMGLRLDRGATVRFWWARIARVWPAYMFMLIFVTIWHGVLLARDVSDPVAVRDYGVTSFIRQALLIVQWTESDSDRLAWNGPAWSVSAEALAYLLFPVIILAVFRFNRVLSTRSLVIAGLLALFPVVFFSYVLGLYAPWMWALRILCAFIAGALVFYVVDRFPDTARSRGIASHIALVAIVGVIVGCFVLDLTGRTRYIGVLIPILVVTVGALGIADRHVARLLGTRIMVIGGMASYSVYLVHMPIIEIFWFAQNQWPNALGQGSVGSKIGFILLPFVVVAAGYLLWRFFEEPSRRKLRSMSVQKIPERAVDDPPLHPDSPAATVVQVAGTTPDADKAAS